jgi:hypothetical protein
MAQLPDGDAGRITAANLVARQGRTNFSLKGFWTPEIEIGRAGAAE